MSSSSDSFRLKDEKPGAGGARVLALLASRAKQVATAPGVDLEERVHQVRLVIKRARALAWLLRPLLTVKAAGEVGHSLRAAAQKLAPQRDAHVVGQVVKHLLPKMRNEEELAAAKQLDAAVSKRPSTTEKRRLAKALKEASSEVVVTLNSLAKMLAQSHRHVSLKKRSERARKSAGKAMKGALKHGASDDFHEYRKKSKRLLYISELLSDASGKPLLRKMELLEKLQAKLGDYHDLDAAEKLVVKLKHAPKNAADALSETFDHERREIRHEVKDLSRKVRKTKSKI